MLEVQHVSAAYGKIKAIEDIDLTVEQGRIVTIVGANGAGKSTLLKAIAGLVPAAAGRIEFEKRRIDGLSADRIVGLGLSLVAEGHQCFGHMTVADNIALGAYLFRHRRYRQAVRDRKDMVYEMFPILARRAGQIAGSLSGGEQQMLAIGRALMADPRLLLLDEPSMGLAPLIVQEILDTIVRLNAMGTTIVLVEQNARAALAIAHHAYVMQTGRIVHQGQAATLACDAKVCQAYLGG